MLEDHSRLHDDVLTVNWDNGKALQFSETGVLPDGQSRERTFNGVWNGLPVWSSDGEILAFRHLSPSVFVRHTLHPKTDSECRISAGGDTLVCDSLGLSNTHEVYDRIQ